MRKTFQIFLFAVAVIFLAHSNIFACKCEANPNLDKMFEESDAVIKGEALIVENFEMEIFALIKVEKSWKGIEEDKVIIKTDIGTCGVNFDAGKTFYLWVDKKDNTYVTVPCRNDRKNQIAFLEEKPTLTLKSSTSDIESELPQVKSTPGSSTSDTTNKTSDQQDNFALTYAFTVIGIVIFALILIVSYMFWKNRKL